MSILYIVLSKDEKVEMIKVETDSTMEDVTITLKKNAVTLWSAHVAKITQPAKSAKSIEAGYNGGSIILSEVQLNFKDKYLVLNAKNGFYDLDKGTIRLSDDITATFKNFKVTANIIEWDNENIIWRCRDNVKIFGEKFLITGGSLCSLPDNKIRIDGNVKASFFI
jgi:hypothetical protein